MGTSRSNFSQARLLKKVSIDRVINVIIDDLTWIMTESTRKTLIKTDFLPE